MDWFYDGQIRRYVTQFMRVFIGFQWQAGDGSLSTVPVMYGDMSRQVANIIKENSENKMLTVPRISCYISGLELATDRLSDPTFVSKVHVRERRYTDTNGAREYQNTQGGNYTVERLMPTPYKLTMKADIWTSNTDQKLQLLEQIAILFNPSLELQTTDNYLDWTSLSTMYLTSTNFSSRTIPAGAESEIDIATLEFEMPIYISPPAKVKKLGIVQAVIANVFNDAGDIVNLEELVYNRASGAWGTTTNRYRVLLFKSNSNNLSDQQYNLTLVNPSAAVQALGLDQQSYKTGQPVEWDAILEVQGGYVPGSDVWFKKADGGEILGTFIINPLDRTILTVTLDADSYPANTDIVGVTETRGTIDAIVDPYKYNPLEIYGSHSNITIGLRFLMLDDVNNSANRGGFINYPADPADSSSVPYRGPQAWREPSNDDSSWSNQDGTDPIITANSIIEWTGSTWTTIWDPAENTIEDASLVGQDFSPTYIQNIRTGIKYKWDGTQWLKAFEGEYGPGDWGFKLL
jgi:hypothetical protein